MHIHFNFIDILFILGELVVSTASNGKRTGCSYQEERGKTAGNRRAVVSKVATLIPLALSLYVIVAGR